MSDNVVALGQADVRSARREEFLRTVAQSFEHYVETYGQEPDAIVYTLSGITQPSQIAWCVEGPSKAGVASILALASTHIAAEAQAGRQGFGSNS